MRIIYFTLCAALLLTYSLAFAKDRKPASKPDPLGGGVEIRQLDPDFPVDELARDGITVHHLGESSPNGLPPLVEQRSMLRKAGLPMVLDWDPVDQDLFVGLVGQQPLDRSLEKYGSRVPADGIRRFRALMDEYRAQRGRE